MCVEYSTLEIQLFFNTCIVFASPLVCVILFVRLLKQKSVDLVSKTVYYSRIYDIKCCFDVNPLFDYGMFPLI